MLKFINLIILIICVLINIAFISLFQRKIFGVMQIRKGPNKLRILGLTQPFSDAIKLFTKELIVPKKSKLRVFTLAPTIIFTISLILWLVIPVLNRISINYRIILIYLLLRLGIFPSFFSA